MPAAGTLCGWAPCSPPPPPGSPCSAHRLTAHCPQAGQGQGLEPVLPRWVLVPRRPPLRRSCGWVRHREAWWCVRCLDGSPRLGGCGTCDGRSHHPHRYPRCPVAWSPGSSSRHQLRRGDWWGVGHGPIPRCCQWQSCDDQTWQAGSPAAYRSGSGEETRQVDAPHPLTATSPIEP